MMNTETPGFAPPRIVTPPHWPATLEEVKAGLARSGAAVTTIGASAGGRDIYATVVGSKTPLFTFGVIGGTHGHEPGGTAAARQTASNPNAGRPKRGWW